MHCSTARCVRRMSLAWAIEFPDKAKPFYICKKNNAKLIQSHNNNHGQSEWAKHLQQRTIMCISLFSSDLSFPENVIRMKELEKNLIRILETNFKMMEFKQISGFRCDLETELPSKYEEMIVFLTPDVNEPDSNMAPHYIQRYLSEQYGDSCSAPELSVINNSNSKSEFSLSTYKKNIAEESIVVAIEPPSCHPAFAVNSTNSVSHSFTSIMDNLKPFCNQQEVKDLIELCLPLVGNPQSLPLKAKHPVIVMEGLDACGKSTLTSNVVKAIGGSLLKSPPKCVSHLREIFDKYPPSLRRLYYSLSNYAFAAMISDNSQNNIVICDRFWHSTAAYAIATDVKVGDVSNLPYCGHTVYDWPSDLLKPDLVYFLNISEEERIRRLKKRNILYTDEEQWLIKSKNFKERMEESYKRMSNPSLTYVNAEKTEKELCSFVIEDLRKRGII